MINLNICIQMEGEDLRIDANPKKDKTTNEYEQFLCEEILALVKNYTQELVEEALNYNKTEDDSYNVCPTVTKETNALPSVNTPVKDVSNTNKLNIYDTGLLKIAYIYTFKKAKEGEIDEGGRKITYDLEDPAFAKEFNNQKKILITRVQAHDYFENPVKTFAKKDVISKVKAFLKTKDGSCFTKEAIADLDYKNSIFVEFFEEENVFWNRDPDEMDDLLDQYNKNKTVKRLYKDGICYLRIPLKSDDTKFVNFYFNYFDCNNKNKHIKDTDVLLIKTIAKIEEDPVQAFSKDLVSMEYINSYSFNFKDETLNKFLKKK